MSAEAVATTCQICGRAVRLDRSGLISHHGYRQPWLRYGTGDGSRTSSCDGSRELPYEVSRDAIPGVRDRYAEAARSTRSAQEALIADPPACLRYVYRDAWGNVKIDRQLERPEGFNPRAARPTWRPGSYEGEFDSRVRSMGQHASGLEEAVAFLSRRYSEWVAP